MYVVTNLAPRIHQITLEELLFGNDNELGLNKEGTTTSTRVYDVDTVSTKVRNKLAYKDTRVLLMDVKRFNNKYKHLISMEDKNDLYEHFCIPKKTHGVRHIDAPKAELREALDELVELLKTSFKADKLYHSSAFAYIKGRCTLDAVRKHQGNKSKWFAKYDLSNFFGSTTMDFTLSMLSQIYPFSEVINNTLSGRDEMKKALSLGFLNGGLPQGTPLSPILTNIIMIPVDYYLFNYFRKEKLVYTRYSDDFIISSKQQFSYRAVAKTINKALDDAGASFKLNEEKTRYGSSAGSNWNLGVMLNKDNEITVGSKNKRRMSAMLTNYVLDFKKNSIWELEDIQCLEGTLNYYRQVERDNINALVDKINNKFNVDVDKSIKLGIKSYNKMGY